MWDHFQRPGRVSDGQYAFSGAAQRQNSSLLLRTKAEEPVLPERRPGLAHSMPLPTSLEDDAMHPTLC